MDEKLSCPSDRFAFVGDGQGKQNHSFALRDYQSQILDILAERLKERPSGRFMVQLPTGMGKTVVFSEMPNVLQRSTAIKQLKF